MLLQFVCNGNFTDDDEEYFNLVERYIREGIVKNLIMIMVIVLMNLNGFKKKIKI